MAKIHMVLQGKGGVGKSTLARALAREAVASGLRVKIGDLDTDQATIIDWHKASTVIASIDGEAEGSSYGVWLEAAG
jgi:chromosome partitioning protein